MHICLVSLIIFFTHLFILAGNHEYLLYILGCNKTTTFFFCSNNSSFGHWKFFYLAYLPLWHSSIFFFVLFVFLFLSASLLPGTTLCSRLTYCISCPNPRISHFSMEPCSFHNYYFKITSLLRYNLYTV